MLGKDDEIIRYLAGRIRESLADLNAGSGVPPSRYESGNGAAKQLNSRCLGAMATPYNFVKIIRSSGRGGLFLKGRNPNSPELLSRPLGPK